ncbi:hypothetical protein NBN67_19600 [Clostridioides difficile]|uniref:hypothetical protein n=1 Tax=Clostridioides difficile TaxID=1496 RepID=UPI00202E2EFF|nr:hypothetical protein [Clostridioides difficile]MCM0739742.1 hypothetical protein [Clostridioides difficile]HBF2930462.1 hypothetical protein [Clostridioides difficile]HBF2935846.1 hypothetical protein [Clostridioides difficile]HBZ0282641.1 hypothetical protein [Clostridioides difficile]
MRCPVCNKKMIESDLFLNHVRCSSCNYEEDKEKVEMMNKIKKFIAERNLSHVKLEFWNKDGYNECFLDTDIDIIAEMLLKILK